MQEQAKPANTRLYSPIPSVFFSELTIEPTMHYGENLFERRPGLLQFKIELILAQYSCNPIAINLIMQVRRF